LVKRPILSRITVTTSAEAEEAVAALLECAVAQPAVSYTDFDTGITTVSAYLEQKPAQWTATFDRLAAGLQVLRAGGLAAGRGRISLTRMKRQDWAESWKRHFRPMEIGRSLLIRPSWSRRAARRGQAVIVLDPGLSFGTGHHPTTRYCLRQLVAARRRGRDQSVLDLGTGSGILAIAAAKLGYRRVDAVDLDAHCLRVASANARRNRVTRKVRFSRQDIRESPTRAARQYSIVCANLIATVLMEHQRGIVARLEPGGLLVMAGILKREFPKVERAYAAAGLRLVGSRVEGEWRSGAFLLARA
jgi:ribosomal protein L11 methyltransferase